MVELDTPQLWEVVLLIFEVECVVGRGCREDGGRANGTGDESVAQDGRVEREHRVGKEGRTRDRSQFLHQSSGAE